MEDVNETANQTCVAPRVAWVGRSALSRPHIARAAAKTATVWWVQGFAEQEDISFKKIVADYEKASGNTIDYSIMPYAPFRQKIVSAMTSGSVPDLFTNNPAEIIALYAWDDKLIDVSDVVDTQREEYTETALLSANCYNSAQKKRSFYGVPFNQSGLLNHIWRPLLEKAGNQVSDIPETWNARYDFFKGVQKIIARTGRAQNLRHWLHLELGRKRYEQPIQLCPDHLWRAKGRQIGWQAASRRSAGA